ncbi:hypothetical protein SRRS_01990 [Sporomusa rhizae]|uniref:WD40 repeat domain-containing protein n=1 Tax=Sporomusa rhizae TaxID=357999 RepID=UPI00352BB30A
MPLQGEDKEYLWQLSMIFPNDYIEEVKRQAEAVIEEQVAAGEHQNIRIIVWDIMTKMRAEAEGTLSKTDNSTDEQDEQQAKAVEEKVLAALSSNQLHIPADMGPEAIEPLVRAFDSQDKRIAANAETALRHLTDGGAIDCFCRLWAETRSAGLEKILVEAGYLAAQPLGIRLLTVLKTGAGRIMLPTGRELIAELLVAVDDADRVIAGRARQLLLTLTDSKSAEAVCERVLAEDNGRLQDWAILAGYAPVDDSKASLYYCITGQWDKYYALDWQTHRPLLAKAYEAAVPTERQRFLQAARGSGHSLLLVSLLLDGSNRAEYEDLSDRDWSAMLDTLVSQERWSELYRLACKAPPGWAAECVLTLFDAGWQPAEWERPNWQKLIANCPQTGRDLFVPDGRQVSVIENWGAGISINCAAFHPNGRIVVGGGSDGRLRLWQTASGALWRTADLHAAGITSVTFTADGQYLVTAGQEGKVHIWRMPDIKWVSSVSGQPGLVTALAAGQQGTLLALACAGGVAPARAWSWDGSQMITRGQYPGSLFSTAAVDWENKAVIGGGRDGKIRSYAVAGGRGGNKLWAAHTGKVESLCISPDGKLFVSGGADGTIKVWQATTGDLLWSIPEAGKLLAISGNVAQGLVANPDERTMAVRQLRWDRPLAFATQADWRQAADLAARQQVPAARQASEFLHTLLSVKFCYDILL